MNDLLQSFWYKMYLSTTKFEDLSEKIFQWYNFNCVLYIEGYLTSLFKVLPVCLVKQSKKSAGINLIFILLRSIHYYKRPLAILRV